VLRRLFVPEREEVTGV